MDRIAVARPIRLLPANRHKCVTCTIKNEQAIVVGHPFDAHNPKQGRGDMERDTWAEVRERCATIWKNARRSVAESAR